MDVNNVCHDIGEQCLVTILKYHNIKVEEMTSNKINYIVLVDRVNKHKAKPKKETNDDTFRRINKPGTPQVHSSIEAHFNIIKKCGKN